MKNRKKLKLKYVIWGQRIWGRPGKGYEKQRSWNKWRTQRDKGSITKNHWYIPRNPIQDCSVPGS
jgi:hypothetical protein